MLVPCRKQAHSQMRCQNCFCKWSPSWKPFHGSKAKVAVLLLVVIVYHYICYLKNNLLEDDFMWWQTSFTEYWNCCVVQAWNIMNGLSCPVRYMSIMLENLELVQIFYQNHLVPHETRPECYLNEVTNLWSKEDHV